MLSKKFHLDFKNPRKKVTEKWEQEVVVPLFQSGRILKDESNRWWWRERLHRERERERVVKNYSSCSATCKRWVSHIFANTKRELKAFFDSYFHHNSSIYVYISYFICCTCYVSQFICDIYSDTGVHRTQQKYWISLGEKKKEGGGREYEKLQSKIK